jgi:hypothetical protein
MIAVSSNEGSASLERQFQNPIIIGSWLTATIPIAGQYVNRAIWRFVYISQPAVFTLKEPLVSDLADRSCKASAVEMTPQR